jgi:hypothetical protein
LVEVSNDLTSTAAAKATLEELLNRGPAEDVFLAEEARAIAQLIDKERGSANATSFARVFAGLHGYAIERSILATTRMYEQPGRFALRNLPAVLAHLEAHAAEIPVVEPNLLRNPLQILGVWSSSFDAMEGPALTRAIVDALRARLPTPDTDSALNTLKRIRDKFLAHREHIALDPVPATVWISWRPKQSPIYPGDPGGCAFNPSAMLSDRKRAHCRKNTRATHIGISCFIDLLP